MYTIYEIPGVKIGCTVDLKTRMRRQGFTEWVVLEEHTDPQIAGDRELELQKQKGYRVDDNHYLHMVGNAHMASAASHSKRTKKQQFQISKKAGSIGGTSTAASPKATYKQKAKCPHCNFSSNPGNVALHIKLSH